MPNGGLRAGVDALTGGPARRRRRMMQRLEELDRLDRLATTAEEVIWPTGRSSRTDPRGWRPGRAPRLQASHWWERHPRMSLVVVGLVVAGGLFAPDITGLVRRALPAKAEAAMGTALPTPGGSSDREAAVVDAGAAPDASTFAFMSMQADRSGPVTFDPCRPIHFVVADGHGAGAAGREAVVQAVAEVSAATGLRFVDDGDTRERPTGDRPLYQPDVYGDRWAPVLVAWSDPQEQPELEGKVAGLGGGRPVRDTHGRLTYVTGTVWLDTPALSESLHSPRTFPGVRAIVMHELAHVVGAGHVQDAKQIMDAENSGQVAWGTGDRYALSVLGSGECVPGL